ncbi:MAG TPA: hypothetical protein VFY21_05795 [Xanthobacteraceae bacterium]|nr:hypothetical protein [Xanthobacteraceae bacterium]
MSTRELQLVSQAVKMHAPAAPGKSFWARVFDSITAARKRGAEDALRIRGDLIAELRVRHGFSIREIQSRDRK